ncbi:Hypothetical predicted protein [Olea europaea subsp. europaea]|uniref:Avr9/Cf-9 rapidly elicited protein 146 n=1 Tax=Olea europaea subsp. europaea TaxID=158383 RepID=A0A8S0PWV3_OLEEU|nr:Hypothetical predicted protein [Olea europaea subsp. europaea]
MEQNLPIITRKVWNIVRTMFLLFRRGISKAKLMSELNIMIKRGKIAGKAIQNLIFHHSHHWSAATSSTAVRRALYKHDSPKEYEFSCSNSPAYSNLHLPFHLNKRKHNHHDYLFSPPPPPATEEDDIVTLSAVLRTLEMLNSAAASPALPGFGKSPMVRKLRITDSPFPLQDVNEEDNYVDEAAEKFIMKFYNDLRRQN